jgi:hypothetical protein
MTDDPLRAIFDQHKLQQARSHLLAMQEILRLERTLGSDIHIKSAEQSFLLALVLVWESQGRRNAC